jgi:WD40 repeat protein
MNKQDNIKEKSPPGLSPKAVFGIRTDIPQNVQFFSGEKCAYAAGNYIVISTIKDKLQYFFPATPEYGEITSFGIDEFNDTIMLAIAQKTLDKSIITLKFISRVELTVEHQKTNKLSLADMDPGDYFISVSINVLRGYIAGLVGPKTPSTLAIYHYDLRKNEVKVHTIIRMVNPIAHRFVQFNPMNPYFISIYGDGGFSVLQISEVDKKTVNKVEVDPRTPQYQEFSNYLFNFVSCTWISKSRVAFLNSSCDVFVIDFARKLENPLKKGIKSVSIFDTQSRGKCIFSKNGNLFVTRDDGLIIKLEEKQQNDKAIVYEKIYAGPKFVQNLPRMEVHSLSINNAQNSLPSFSAILISTETSQLFYVDISNENALTDGNNYKYFLCPFHSEDITCVDVAKMKPILATCSKDRYIKIWNYINLQLENSELFEEEPIYLAFHPNGLHLGVLFREKFRLMNILEKGIVSYRDFPIYQPADIKFSNFGNFFSICFKNSFQIYNFYTCEVVFTSKSVEGHAGEVTALVWDQDDSGFATCGQDGRAFYWTLYSKEPQQIEYHNREMRFNGVGIYSYEENNQVNKKLLLLDENILIEVGQTIKDPNNLNTLTNKKEDQYSSIKVDNKKEKPKILLKDESFSQLVYDHESKLIITSSAREHAPTIRITRYPLQIDQKEIITYQANAFGVKSIRTTFDMTHLFTTGKDKCLFFFNINNVIKTDKRDETLETDLILVKKDDLDKEALELKSKLQRIDSEIEKEKETFDKIKSELENEKSINESLLKNEKERFAKERSDLETKIFTQRKFLEEELAKIRGEHKEKMEDLRHDQEKNKMGKDKDKEKENENFEKEKNKDSNYLIQTKKRLNDELKKIQEGFEKRITDLNKEIKVLQDKNEGLSSDIDKVKTEMMDSNDTQISMKRLELENLKTEFENIKKNFNHKEDSLKDESKKIKDLIRAKENKKTKERGELQALQQENSKLAKQIEELRLDISEKNQTIEEKNNIKRELEKENQELEKFKFVLNYKIKELKQEKDPKENKLQTLEKQAKDMDREIKNFEFAQANYIINLSTNHEIMKLYERQISDTEKRIEKLKNYKKLFQESLYHSMKRAKDHKGLKKELVNLKRLFLDKEFIEMVEKPYESNYESQRQFFENNITDYKQKIENTQKLFGQDHQKIMRENMNLIKIVNELEREKKDIESIPHDSYNPNKPSSILKPKASIKENLPLFAKGNSSSNEQQATLLKKELYEIEKELQLIKLKQKKEKENKEKGKKDTKITSNV